MKKASNNRAKTGGQTRDTAPPLIGWGAIADHLGCSIPTARKWHSTAGLPIRKVGGTRIEASASEIDEWRHLK